LRFVTIDATKIAPRCEFDEKPDRGFNLHDLFHGFDSSKFGYYYYIIASK
jgi:hypothetical protein